MKVVGIDRRSYKSLKKPSPLSAEQRHKFGAYLLSRRSVTSPRGAALLLDAALAIADDQVSTRRVPLAYHLVSLEAAEPGDTQLLPVLQEEDDDLHHLPLNDHQ